MGRIFAPPMVGVVGTVDMLVTRISYYLVHPARTYHTEASWKKHSEK